MGHEPTDVGGALYVERVDDDRLRAVRCRPLTVGLTGSETTCIWKRVHFGWGSPQTACGQADHHRCAGGVRASEELLPPRLLGGLNYEMAISDSLGGEIKQDGE